LIDKQNAGIVINMNVVREYGRMLNNVNNNWVG